MSTASANPSLEPYLRARAADPSLIPPLVPRSSRHRVPTQTPHSDFIDFLTQLSKWVLAPITVPINILHATFTSPLTLSLILKLALLGFITLASAVFSFLAVGAFWWSWGTGGMVETEGWLVYGSKVHRTPHALIPLAIDTFHEDLRYDIQVEMELVRPSRGAEEMGMSLAAAVVDWILSIKPGNFMLGLQLRSLRTPDQVILSAAQPSLPPPPLPSTLFSIPSLHVPFVPCVIPYPFRGLCPSRLFGYSQERTRLKKRAKNSPFASPAKGKDVVLLRTELMEGVILRPGSGGDAVVGAAFVSIGREDSFFDAQDEKCAVQPREVRTTGWVVVRFIPRPSGVRWLLTSHPLPPLLLLPPISLTLTLSSSVLAFLLITFLRRGKKTSRRSLKKDGLGGPMTEEGLLAEKNKRVFEERDREERREAERRKEEWEEVENGSGLRRLPADKRRESTIGGSETTAPTVRSFGPIPEASEDGTETTTTETPTGGHREEEESDGWEDTGN
ncbi:hypothetical protein P7C73_g2256, partial [Tremellales sp. Uapishka_1]